MNRIPFSLRQLAVVAALCAAGASNATIAFVNSSAAAPFNTATIDTFADLPINTDLATLSLTRTAGPFKYVVGSTFNNATYSSLFTVPLAGNRGVSTGWFADSLVFTILSPSVLGFGGNFLASNILGEATSGALTLTATDTAGLSFTQSIAGGSLTAFSGFVSDVPLRFLTVTITTPNNPDILPAQFATADNIRITTAIPEPATWMMMLAGFAIALRIGNRRRR